MKMPSKKKKYNARFPAGRIKKIMQMDDDVGKIAHAVPVVIYILLSSSIFYISKSIIYTANITRERNAKTLSLTHTKHCILKEQKFDFLKELVKNIDDVSPEEERKSSRNNAVLSTVPHVIQDVNYDISRKRIKSEPRLRHVKNLESSITDANDNKRPTKRRYSECDSSCNMPESENFKESASCSANSFHNSNYKTYSSDIKPESCTSYDLIIDEECDI
ncbi:hypothetical protein PGB90_005856 [Kerria lacca]